MPRCFCNNYYYYYYDDYYYYYYYYSYVHVQTLPCRVPRRCSHLEDLPLHFPLPPYIFQLLMTVPKTLEELKSCKATKSCVTFDNRVNPNGHATTDYGMV